MIKGKILKDGTIEVECSDPSELVALINAVGSPTLGKAPSKVRAPYGSRKVEAAETLEKKKRKPIMRYLFWNKHDIALVARIIVDYGDKLGGTGRAWNELKRSGEEKRREYSAVMTLASGIRKYLRTGDVTAVSEITKATLDEIGITPETVEIPNRVRRSKASAVPVPTQTSFRRNVITHVED